jgi:hypothetical protein
MSWGDGVSAEDVGPQKYRGSQATPLFPEAPRLDNDRSRDCRAWSAVHLLASGISAQPCCKPLGIEGGFHLCVVVEVHEDVGDLGALLWFWRDELCVLGLPAFLPEPDSFGPPIQGAVGVAAGVDFLGAVEADVDEVASQIFGVGPLPALSAKTKAMRCFRRSAKNSGTRKLRWRTSTQWRSGRGASASVQAPWMSLAV